MTLYLPDTSALARTHHEPVARRLRDIGAQNTRTCTPVLLELGYSARNADEHARWVAALSVGVSCVPMSTDIERRAVQVQGLLAARGQHRSARLADLLIAAVAEAHGLIVLHYDHDYDLIAEVTGQHCEWVVPKGSVG